MSCRRVAVRFTQAFLTAAQTGKYKQYGAALRAAVLERREEYLTNSTPTAIAALLWILGMALFAAAAVQNLHDYMAFKIGMTQFTGHPTIAEALQQMNRADSPEFLAGIVDLAASKVGDGAMYDRKHDHELMANPTPDGMLGLAMRLIAIPKEHTGT